MQSQQPSLVTLAPSPAPIINHSLTTYPTTTAQPSSVAQAPTKHATNRLDIRTAVSTPTFY
eukprot:1986743-Pleurochrysis_carterae.AAC.1